MKKKKKRGLWRLLSSLAGFACALVLGALFYATMVYQLTGVPQAQSRDGAAFAVLELPFETTGQSEHEEVCGGEICRVITREYDADGRRVTAVSASSPAYFERLAQEGWTPQLITGFTLAGLDAVCEQLGGESMLIARSGGAVYALRTQADEQTLYALGAAATLR